MMSAGPTGKRATPAGMDSTGGMVPAGTQGAGGHAPAAPPAARQFAPEDDRLARLRRRYRRLLSITLFLTFDLIIFGAFVRLVDAGLGCPDWPGCYGHVTPHGAAEHIAAEMAVLPDGPVTVFKAWVEMLHRYIASGLGLLVIILLVLGVRWRRQASRLAAAQGAGQGAGQGAALGTVQGTAQGAAQGTTQGSVQGTGRRAGASGGAPKRYADGGFAPSVALAAFTLVWIILQGLFGMWTVTLRLMPVVVTAHLMGAMILFMALMAQHNRVQPQPDVAAAAARHARWARALLVLLLCQLMLGGWVSSNYAALACEDFPACHGSLWPDMDLSAGFELWRPLGTRADGEPLEYQALTGIHYVHRLMAYGVFLLAAVLAWRLWRVPGLSTQARWLAGVVLVQFITGLANVFLGWPLVAALAHTAGAAGLVAITFMIDFRTRIAGILPSSPSTVADRRGRS